MGGVEGTDDFGDCLGRYGGVAGGGVDAAMAEQDLDGAGVGAIFEQVSGEAVTAMHLLQSGVDITLIALWLGHESPATTHIYVEADLKMKEAALQLVQPPNVKGGRYKPPEGLLAFLRGL